MGTGGADMSADARQNSIWNRNFICILAANCLLQMSNSATNTQVSTYATFLGAGPKLMGLITGLFYMVSLAVRPVAGPVQTRANHKRLLTVIFALAVVVNTGYALFHSVPMFVLFRVLHGVQYAFIGSLLMTITTDSLPPEKIAAGVGIFGVSSSVAQAVAPRVGIFLRAWGTQRGGEDLGYTAIFVFAVVVLLLAQIPCRLLISDQRPRTVGRTADKWYRQIISGPAIWPSVIVLLLLVSYSTYTGFMVPFGEELGLKDVGVFFSVLAVGMLAIRVCSGWLSEKLGLQNVLAAGTVLFLVSFLIVGNARSLTGIVAGAAVAAVGFGNASPLSQALTMQTEAKERRPVASNTLYLGMDVGFFLGPMIAGFVRDYAGSFRSVILAGSASCALALLVLLLTWPGSRRRMESLRGQGEAEKPE